MRANSGERRCTQGEQRCTGIHNDEQITIQDLIGRMGDNLAGSEYDAYSYKYMLQIMDFEDEAVPSPEDSHACKIKLLYGG